MPEGLTAISTGVRWFKKRRRPCKKFITYSLCLYTWFCILYNAQEAGEEPAGNQWRPGAWQWALCTLRGLPLIEEEVVLPPQNTKYKTATAIVTGPPVPHRADWEQDKKVSFLVIGLMRRFFALVVWLDLCTEMEVWRILIHDICQFWAPSHYLALSKYINNIATNFTKLIINIIQFDTFIQILSFVT